MHRKSVAGNWAGFALIVVITGVARRLLTGNAAGRGREHVWSAEPDPSTGAVILVRGGRIRTLSGDPAKLVLACHKVFEEAEPAHLEGEHTRMEHPRQRPRSVEGGVAHVEVANSEYLVRQMGSSGAQFYLAAATFTLTECRLVRTVDYHFPEGDHASPGAYARESFAVPQAKDGR